ncbi:MAG: hypothetical protein KGI70_00775 [Patescibacteria group bacterium]|nr:hypothetical protein [Patescibacteria group bacterium]
MRYHPLQELAKLAAGLAAADFFWFLWFSQSHLRTANFFGASVDQSIVWPAMLFDIAAFLILVHYGWHVGKLPQMRERNYILVAGAIFTVVAAAHIWRIFTGADIVIMGWVVPVWLSWFGVAIATYLAYTSFHFLSRMGGKRR